MDADIWFREWTSKNGQKLSKMQITRLVALTRQWRSDIPSDTLSIWTSNPSAEFWGFEPFQTESAWVRECLETKVPTFEDCEGITEDCEKVSARRRVLLIILHDIIQREILRLRASPRAQSVKFLTAAVRNIVGQAYPGKDDKKLCDKCTSLQRYGQRYSSLTRKELVLTPLQATSNFERAKIENIETEALVAFGEATYDEKHRNDLQKAFECILNTYPFKRPGNSKLRLPSNSTRRRLRKKAARTKDAQKLSAPPTTSHQNETQVIRNSFQQELISNFDSSRPRPDTFSSLEKPPVSGETSSHVPDGTLVDQVSKEVLNPSSRAWNAAPMQPEEHLFDLCFNPSDSLENLPEMTQHVDQLFYGTWSANADPCFNPSASLESLPGTLQLEETGLSNCLSPGSIPSGYLGNLPQVPQNSTASNITEPTTTELHCLDPSASLECLPGTFPQNDMHDMRPKEAQPFENSPPRFNPSGYFENLPQNSIAFDNTEQTAIDLPFSKPSASLESLQTTYRNSIAPLLNNMQSHDPSKTQFNPSSSLETFPSRNSGSFLLRINHQGHASSRPMDSHHSRFDRVDK